MSKSSNKNWISFSSKNALNPVKTRVFAVSTKNASARNGLWLDTVSPRNILGFEKFEVRNCTVNCTGSNIKGKIMKQRKQRTIKPYHRTHDGWWYATSKRFFPLLGTDRVKLVKGPKDRATEQQAVVELQKLLARVDADSMQEEMPLGVLAEKYLEWLESRVTENHFTAIKSRLVDFCEYYGDLSVADFNETALDKMDRWLRFNSKGGKGKYNWTSADSQYKSIATIKAMFNYGCARLKFNRTNCAVFGYENPERESRVTYFTPEQEKAILKCLTSKRDKGEFAEFFAFLLETGARTFVEGAAVTAENIEWENGQPVCLDMGKVKRKRRLIYLSPAAQEIVKRLVKQYPTGPLFRNARDSQWLKSTATRRLNVVLRNLVAEQPELGLTMDHSLYSCRHTFIVRKLVETNGNVALVAEMAGNTIFVLEKHYKKWGTQKRTILESLGHKTKDSDDDTPPPLRVVA